MTLEAARKDWKRFVTTGGFQVLTTLKTPDELTVIEVNALAMKHHLSIDSDGRELSAKNAHITIIEQDLVDASYPVRNAAGEVALLKHLVSYPDSTGSVKHYVIIRNYPDETVGVITCILGDYENGS